MKKYKMLIISLLLLVFMVGAVSAADENVTNDNLEISDEISVNEEIASSDVEEISSSQSEDIIGQSEDNILGNIYGITSEDVVAVYGEGSEFSASFINSTDTFPIISKPMSNINVVFEISDESGQFIKSIDAVTNGDGIASFNIDLPIGTYIVLSKNPQISTQTTESYIYVVSERIPLLNADNITVIHGEDIKYHVKINDPFGNPIPDTYVSWMDENEEYYGEDVTDENGEVVFDIDLPVGVYSIILYDEYNDKEVFRTFTILAKPSVSVDENATFNCGSGSKYYPMSFTNVDGAPLANGAVEVSIDGVYNYTLTTDENGTVDFLLPSLAGGDHIMTITNPVTGEKINTTITYMKEASSISAAAVTTVYNGGKYVVFTLKDSNGAALSGKNVSVVLNGKTIKGVTDANGQFKVSTDGLAPKTYTATMTFAGDDYLVNSTATAKITVKKATPKMTAKKAIFKAKKKIKKYSIVLKDNKNKAMKKVKVTLKVGKKTYKATTNAKGKATFKITKLTKKGKYTAKVKFAGNKNYNVVTKKVKITVKK